MQSVKRIVLAGIIFLGAMGGFGVSGTAAFSPSNAGGSEPDRAVWKYLAYRGNHFLGKVKTEVSLADLPAKEARKQLISIPEGNPLETSTAPVMVIDVQSNVDPLFRATDLSGSRAWFSSDNAAALQRIRFRRGNDIWQNTYRFTQSGVYRIRKKPDRADEQQLEPAHWTRIKESFFPYQPVGPESKIVMEPTGLLYLASHLDLRSTTGPRSLYVFDRKQLHEVTVQVNERRRLKVSYIEKGRQKEIQRQGLKDAVRISFKPRALVSQGEQPEQFSFMGLKGDFEIYIDPASRIPVQVSGQIARIGKIHIRLQTVEF
jgi:hypothetical protein